VLVTNNCRQKLDELIEGPEPWWALIDAQVLRLRRWRAGRPPPLKKGAPKLKNPLLRSRFFALAVGVASGRGSSEQPWAGSKRETSTAWSRFSRSIALRVRAPVRFGPKSVDAPLALEHPVANHLAADRRRVFIVAFQNCVDFRFGVAPILFEPSRKPLEYCPAFLALNRN